MGLVYSSRRRLDRLDWARFVDFLEDCAQVCHTAGTVPVSSPKPNSRATRGTAELPRIFLLCPEPLAASAYCVEDALRARGYWVRVDIGRRARRWVRHAPPGSPSLRVLCVPQIDSGLAQQLRQGREDFHIVAMSTPLAVVREIERITGRRRSDRKPRPSRMILAQPTLIEQSLHADRSWGLGMAVMALGLLAVGGILGASLSGGSAEPAASAPAAAAYVVEETAEGAVAPRARERERVLSAAAPVRSRRWVDTPKR